MRSMTIDKKMRLRIILSLILLTLLTGCGAKDNKLIEIESELGQDQGNAQICVYNDVFKVYGKKKNYTFIDIIKDNEVKETINTYRYLDKATDIDCFDFNGDGIKDIAVIGVSGSEPTILLYESKSDYHYDVFSGWSDVGDVIKDALDDDFSMNELKSILDNYVTSDIAFEMLDSENWSYKAGDYKEAYAAIARLLGPKYNEAKYALVDIDGNEPLELVISTGGVVAAFNYDGGYAHKFLVGTLGVVASREYEYSPGKSIIRHLGGNSPTAVYYKEYIPILEGFEQGDSVAFLECYINDFDGDGEITEKEWEMSSPESEIAYETWYEPWSENEISNDELKRTVDSYNSLNYESLSGSLSFDEFVKELE